MGILSSVAGFFRSAFRILGDLFLPAPPQMPGTQAGEVSYPDLGSGSLLPLVLGKRIIAGTIVWWGDVRTEKIIKGKQNRQHIANWYSWGCHILLAEKIDTIHKIYGADTEIFSGAFTSGVISITGRNQYGGFDVDNPGGEGGLEGEFEFLTGDESQGLNIYLYNKLGQPTYMPHFIGVASIIWRGIFGVSPQPREFRFECSRYENVLPGVSPYIGEDMNPAVMIYFIYIRGGVPTNRMDTASFVIAANTLASENFGLSFVIQKSISLIEVRDDILRHIDGYVSKSSATGKYSLVLNRVPNLANIPTFTDSSGISQIDSFVKLAPKNRVNEVIVGYSSRKQKYERDTVSSQSTAIIFQNELTISQTIEYDGVTTAELAARLADRDRRVLGASLSEIQLRGDRRMAEIMPGTVFRVSSAKSGILSIVLRASEVSLGTLESGEILIKATEDVFSIDQTALTTPPSSGWTPPGVPPTSFTYTLLLELPFQLLYLVEDVTPLTIEPAATFIGAAGVPADSGQMYANIFSYQSGSFVNSGSMPFCGTAVSPFAVSKTDTVITVDTVTYADNLAVGDLISWGDEILRVDFIGVGTLTLARGCLDTVPIEHAMGSRMFLLEFGLGSDSIKYANGNTAQVKGVTTSLLGQLPVGSAPTVTKSLVARQGRPYPPGQFKINNAYYPASVDFSSDVIVTWTHRNRIAQYDNPILATTENYTGDAEAWTTYTVELRRADNNGLLASQTGLTGKTATFTDLDVDVYTGAVRIVLFSVRGGIQSYQKHTHDMGQI